MEQPGAQEPPAGWLTASKWNVKRQEENNSDRRISVNFNQFLL